MNVIFPAETEASASEEVTDLLRTWSEGDAQAAEEVLPLLYAQLRRIAGRCMGAERPDHTLQPTALVHEAYLRLLAQRGIRWENRSHFLAVAATMMRRILVDHARAIKRDKRGAMPVRVDARQLADPAGERFWDLLALDQALRTLARLDRRKVSVIEIHFFAGLSVEEAARVLGCSAATVTRDWRLAKAWLSRELADRSEHGR